MRLVLADGPMLRAVTMLRAAVGRVDSTTGPSHRRGEGRLVPFICTVGARGARLLQELGDDGFGPRRAALREGPEADFTHSSPILCAEGREGLALGAAPQELVAELFVGPP